MLISIRDFCIMEPQSELDRWLLSTSSACTKLAFKCGNVCDSVNIIKLEKSDGPYLTYSENQINLGFDEINRIVFLFRIALDSLIVKHNGVPIHAALVKRDKCALILGHSGAGKSAVSLRLLQKGGLDVVGDDHIVFLNGYISGNMLLRERCGGDLDDFHHLSRTLISGGDLVIVCVRIQKEISCTERNAAYLYHAGFVQDAMKYLTEPFLFSDRTIPKEDLVGKDIVDNYRFSFQSLIESCCSIYEVCGPLDDITRLIRGLI